MKLTSIFLYILNLKILGTLSQDLCDPKKTGDLCDEDCKQECHLCYKDRRCFSCEPGYYGEDCNNQCSNCIDGLCSKDDGKCNNKDYCEGNKYYTEYCNKECTEIDENCLECNIGGICEKCSENHYGDYCNNTCPHCIGGCSIDGICNNTEYCENYEYYGEFCDKKCKEINENCDTCFINGTCKTCLGNNYGNYCNASCTNCIDGCNINDGKCNFTEYCKDFGYFGEYCKQECKEINKSCNTCFMNGTCQTCSGNFYGNYCNISCPNCIDGCAIEDGKCNFTEYCKGHLFYGEKCDKRCDDPHLNCSKCNMSGICIECHGKNYGNHCENSCENCLDLCDIEDGTCLGNPDHCIGYKFHEKKCDKRCDEVHKSCETCDINGICLSCKDNEKSNITCETDCPKFCAKNHNQKPVCNIQGQCRGCELYHYGTFCENDCYGCGTGCDDEEGNCKDFKCNEGKYGLKCDQNCTCETNSQNDECGKFSGQCLNCRFGYFGKDCSETCHYKCRTGLCCIYQKNKEFKTELLLKNNYKYLTLQKNNTSYNIEIDYNYGFPLVLFNKNSKTQNCDHNIIKTIDESDISKEVNKNNPFSEYYFTNYKIGGFSKKEKIKFNNTTELSINITLASEITCNNRIKHDNQINGVIGLGFFNTISNALFKNLKEPKDAQNILSYSLEGNDIELLFGSMSELQTTYIEKLTYCDVKFIKGTDINGKKMSCILQGIKSSKQDKALQLSNDSRITFSIAENSSLVLKYDDSIINYLKNEYFKGEADNELQHDSKTNTYFFTFPQDKINKLSNFGFVFNDYFYQYEPGTFFDDYNGKKRFLIEFSKDVTNSEFVLGKRFLEDIKFTINNEEARIYFYAQRAEYSNEFENYKESSRFGLSLSPRENSAIILSIIITFNLIAFVAYYFIKKKRMNSPNYVKIE